MVSSFFPLLAATITPFDWQRVLFLADAPASYLLEVAFRSVVLFVLTIVAFRIMGKRGVRRSRR